MIWSRVDKAFNDGYREGKKYADNEYRRGEWAGRVHAWNNSPELAAEIETAEEKDRTEGYAEGWWKGYREAQRTEYVKGFNDGIKIEENRKLAQAQARTEGRKRMNDKIYTGDRITKLPTDELMKLVDEYGFNTIDKGGKYRVFLWMDLGIVYDDYLCLPAETVNRIISTVQAERTSMAFWTVEVVEASRAIYIG